MIKRILKVILKKCSWSTKNEILNFLILENVYSYPKTRVVALLKSKIKEIEED